MNHLRALAAVALVFLTLGTAEAGPSTATILGRLVQPDGRGIAGARVWAEMPAGGEPTDLARSRTDSSGAFRLTIPVRPAPPGFTHEGLSLASGVRLRATDLEPGRAGEPPSLTFLPVNRIVPISEGAEPVAVDIVIRPAGLLLFDGGKDYFASRPCPVPIFLTTTDGEAVPSYPFELDGRLGIAAPVGIAAAVHIPAKIPGFGEVLLSLDNGGEGFLIDRPGSCIMVDRDREALRTTAVRLARIAGGRAGMPVDVADVLTEASTVIEEAEAQGGRPDDRDESFLLARVLGLSERAVLRRAREAIPEVREGDLAVRLVDEAGNPLAGRKVSYKMQRLDFDLGFSPAGPLSLSLDHLLRRMSKAGFNHYLHRPYWSQTEPEPGRFHQLRRPGFFSLFRSAGFTMAAEGLVALEPGRDSRDLAGLPFEDLVDRVERHVRRVVRAYSEISRWTVSHEAAYRCTSLGLTRPQAMEVIEAAARAVAAERPGAQAGVYLGYPDGSFAGYNLREDDDRYTMNPWSFVRRLLDQGVPIDFLALPITAGSCLERLETSSGRVALDLAAVADLIDQYARLGLPVHLTEVNFPSRPDDCLMGRWHRDPDEALQAEWARALYTIAFSRKAVREVTWYLVNDDLYYRAGIGLFDALDRPKPALRALSELFAGWRSEGAAVTDESGMARWRGFFGDYEMSSGPLRGRVEMRDEAGPVELVMRHSGRLKEAAVWVAAALLAALAALASRRREPDRLAGLPFLALGAWLLIGRGQVGMVGLALTAGGLGLYLRQKLLGSVGALWGAAYGLLDLGFPERYPWPVNEYLAFVALRTFHSVDATIACLALILPIPMLRHRLISERGLLLALALAISGAGACLWCDVNLLGFDLPPWPRWVLFIVMANPIQIPIFLGLLHFERRGWMKRMGAQKKFNAETQRRKGTERRKSKVKE